MMTLAAPLKVLSRKSMRADEEDEIEWIRYTDISDEPQRQTNFVQKFQRDLMKKYEEESDEHTHLNRRVFAGSLYQDLVDTQFELDLAWSLGSVCFVFTYINFHLGSTFLAAISMAMIMLSFPLT
jgi:hypothetical protein